MLSLLKNTVVFNFLKNIVVCGPDTLLYYLRSDGAGASAGVSLLFFIPLDGWPGAICPRSPATPLAVHPEGGESCGWWVKTQGAGWFFKEDE